MVLEPLEATNPDVTVEDVEALIDTNYAGKLKSDVEAAIKAKWSKIMGPDVEIVVNYRCPSACRAVSLISMPANCFQRMKEPHFFVQGGSNMTGTNCDLFTHKSSWSYLNHLVVCG
jgi:hypothetical protein